MVVLSAVQCYFHASLYTVFTQMQADSNLRRPPPQKKKKKKHVCQEKIYLSETKMTP